MKLHYVSHGNRNRPLILLLHGFLGSHRDWTSLAESLGTNFHCVAVDLPGHGQTEGGEVSDYTFPSIATRLIDLVDTFDVPSFSVVGYSMGGRLALYLVSIYAMRIDALVLESCTPGLQSAEERRSRLENDEKWARVLEAEDMATFLDAWYSQPLFHSLLEKPETFQCIKSNRMNNHGPELARALRGMSVARQNSLWDAWKENHIPTLLITGEKDAKYCDIVARMQRVCASSRTALIPGAGHNVHEEAPDAYNSAVTTFLSQILNP